MPESNITALVTRTDTKGNNYVTTADFWLYEAKFRIIDGMGFGVDITDEVVAWQPFPEPYI